MAGSRASSGDLEAGPSGAYSGTNPFAAAMAREDLRSQPILEDDGRPSIDTRRSSHAAEAEEVSITHGMHHGTLTACVQRGKPLSPASCFLPTSAGHKDCVPGRSTPPMTHVIVEKV